MLNKKFYCARHAAIADLAACINRLTQCQAADAIKTVTAQVIMYDLLECTGGLRAVITNWGADGQKRYIDNIQGKCWCYLDRSGCIASESCLHRVQQWSCPQTHSKHGFPHTPDSSHDLHALCTD